MRTGGYGRAGRTSWDGWHGRLVRARDRSPAQTPATRPPRTNRPCAASPQRGRPGNPDGIPQSLTLSKPCEQAAARPTEKPGLARCLMGGPGRPSEIAAPYGGIRADSERYTCSKTIHRNETGEPVFAWAHRAGSPWQLESGPQGPAGRVAALRSVLRSRENLFSVQAPVARGRATGVFGGGDCSASCRSVAIPCANSMPFDERR
jgi:hypothetical protein